MPHRHSNNILKRGKVQVNNATDTRVRDKKRLEKVGNLVKNSYLYR